MMSPSADCTGALATDNTRNKTPPTLQPEHINYSYLVEKIVLHDPYMNVWECLLKPAPPPPLLQGILIS